ncbi:MAG: hypothetical protein HYX26_07300 [Acidobacteriales bacterium]|nr:hypothetical protein [Terriglobales bacterium]
MADSSPTARAAGRAAGRMIRRNRYVNAGIEAAGVTLNSTRRTVRKLWLEVTGFFFASFALIGLAATAREYQSYAAGQPVANRMYLAAGFTLMFAWFAVTSFLRSRRD